MTYLDFELYAAAVDAHFAEIEKAQLKAKAGRRGRA